MENVIGKKIKRIRKKLGITQTEFGNLFGVSKQSVSSWENGVNMPDVASLIDIAKKCNVDILYLIGLNEKITSDNEEETFNLTEREKILINKVRSMSPERQRGLEMLLGIRR